MDAICLTLWKMIMRLSEAMESVVNGVEASRTSYRFLDTPPSLSSICHEFSIFGVAVAGVSNHDTL